MPDKPSDLVPGTLDLLILKTLALEPMHGYGISVRIGRFSPQCRLTVARYSAARKSWTDQGRMERNGEQQTSKVLRSDGTRAKEAQQRNARMGEASGGDREDSGGLVR